MKIKGEYRQKYIIDKEKKELVVNVILKQHDGLQKPNQNIWYGVATVNDKEIKHKDLPYCVNAEYMAETIGLEIIDAWKKRAKNENKIFRLKRK
ncbi:MAG: hypothetical protein DRN27_05840 [Thermoplasmata archaeon]|nr:MAG: hypothetical protein DRN27_05840 [Thermoplasmata archaeon]